MPVVGSATGRKRTNLSEIRMTSYQNTNAVADSTQEAVKVRYTAKTHTSGGRRGGVSRRDDGRLDVMFPAPGLPGTGTNPEQLFAAGWSVAGSRDEGGQREGLPGNTRRFLQPAYRRRRSIRASPRCIWRGQDGPRGPYWDWMPCLSAHRSCLR